MTPEQLAQVLIGIARAQANVLSAVEEKLDKSSLKEVRQRAQALNHSALTDTSHKKLPVTLQTLPIKLLEAALAPGSVAGKEIEKTALAESRRLLS